MSQDLDPYIFTSNSLPNDPRFLPPLANGLLGWRVYNNIMHMGGVYNGEGGHCHRADVPCPLAVKVQTEDASQHSYTLDTHTGSFHRAGGSMHHFMCFYYFIFSIIYRHFHPRSNLSQCKRLTVFVLSPVLPQHHGDGGPAGTSGDLSRAGYSSSGQFLHSSEQRHCF